MTEANSVAADEGTAQTAYCLAYSQSWAETAPWGASWLQEETHSWMTVAAVAAASSSSQSAAAAVRGTVETAYRNWTTELAASGSRCNTQEEVGGPHGGSSGRKGVVAWIVGVAAAAAAFLVEEEFDRGHGVAGGGGDVAASVPPLLLPPLVDFVAIAWVCGVRDMAKSLDWAPHWLTALAEPPFSPRSPNSRHCQNSENGPVGFCCRMPLAWVGVVVDTSPFAIALPGY
jgi:hypothetical protein